LALTRCCDRFSIQDDVSMAVPKRKSSNSRTGARRSHHAKTPRQLSTCPKCSEQIPTHVVCPTCGYYMGRVVVDMTPEEEKTA
jgi:large subunit ribosomal protein L32